MYEAATLLLTLLGFGATLYGVHLTFRQAKQAAVAAEEASDAVEQFKVRSKRQEASRDIASIVNGLEETVRHLEGDSWRNAVASYELVRRSLIRLQVNDLIADGQKGVIDGLSSHIVAFCEAVDLSEADEGPVPDKSQISRYIRECYVGLAKIDADLIREL